MIAHAPSTRNVREPKPSYDSTRRSRHKQIARIICHLRDELYGTDPQLSMPTRWMVECLVFNACDNSMVQSGDWENIVINALESIRSLASAQLGSTYRFTRRDGVRPLFPNEELFDELDVLHFCQAILQHLKRELSL